MNTPADPGQYVQLAQPPANRPMNPDSINLETYDIVFHLPSESSVFGPQLTSASPQGLNVSVKFQYQFPFNEYQRIRQY